MGGRRGNERLERLGQDGHVKQGRNVDGELDQDRKQDVEVEDVAQRSLARQLLDRLQVA